MKNDDDIFNVVFNDIKPILKDIYYYDNYTCKHSLQVGMLVYEFGKYNNLNKIDLQDLTCAGLLHDYGKIGIDINIIRNNLVFSSTNMSLMQEIKSHVIKTKQFLTEKYDENKYNYINKKVITIASQHHETEDGLGYPLGLTGLEINHLAKIIHVADTFDAIASKRCYKPAFGQERLYSEMLKNVEKYDLNILKKFIMEMSFIKYNEIENSSKLYMNNIDKEYLINETLEDKINKLTLPNINNEILDEMELESICKKRLFLDTSEKTELAM